MHKKRGNQFYFAEWLAKYMRSVQYKKLKVEDKKVHPRLVFIVVTEFWKRVWEVVHSNRLVTMPYLGSIMKTQIDTQIEFVWFRKPHMYAKLAMSKFYYKNFILDRK